MKKDRKSISVKRKKHIKHTNIVEAKDGSPISIENLKVHVMAKGNYYKLEERQFYSRIEKEIEAKV